MSEFSANAVRGAKESGMKDVREARSGFASIVGRRVLANDNVPT
jgi:hypothetical protein